MHTGSSDRRRRITALLGCLLLARPLVAAGDEDEMALFELEEYLNAQTTVASRKARTLRESPGVITIVTREEIRSSGARDLIDVLRLVPGFSLGHDVEGVVGPGFRGNWGYEGKILLMVDGVEQNELLYSTMQLGHHFPLHHLERIEIIRGPGSAIYGGNAELATINLITRGPASLDGFSASAELGQADGELAHGNVSLCYGKLFDKGKNAGFSIAAFAGQGQRATRTYQDVEGSVYAMDGNSDLDPLFLNLFGSYGGFHARLIHDRYRTTERDSFGTHLPRAGVMDFTSTFFEVAYELPIGQRWKLTPTLAYRHHTPWRVQDKSLDDFYDKSASRASGTIALAYDDAERLDFNVGVQAYQDRGTVNDLELAGSQTLFGDDDEVTYDNLAGFAELTFEGGFGTVLLGARYDNHSEVEDSFVPRVAYTKVWDKFHLKALYSEAFRAPGIENINLSDPASPIRPETTRVLELEAGWQLGKHVFVSANVFDLDIDDPIVYYFDPVTEAENYVNFPATGSRGFEATSSFRHDWGYVNLSYSYATIAGKNEVPLYAVPGDEDVLVGMSPHKLTAAARIDVWNGLSINPSAIWSSAAHAFTSVDEDGVTVIEELDARLLVNLFVNYADLGVDGLDLGLGIYNLTDEDHEFIQPYDGGKFPLPGPGREIFARFAYSF